MDKHPLLLALQGKNLAAPPVWLMRQAGRYMAEYRALRGTYPFLEMVHHPELAAAVTMLPVNQLGVDAAILFSDILVVVEALGVGLHFDEGIGPIIDRPLSGPADLSFLPTVDVRESLGYVAAAIKLLRQELSIPLIGFCGAPFTLASYMIEGRSSRQMRKTKTWMLSDPESFHRLLERITAVTIDYLTMQIEAGAQVIQIFDSWAHVLGNSHFQDFSLAYMARLVKAVQAKGVPVILFCRGAGAFASHLAATGANGISIDWNGDLRAIRQTLGAASAGERHHPRGCGVTLQGNLDPDILLAPKSVVIRETANLLRAMDGDPAYIFNLGHGILPETPFENVKALIDTVKSY
jgi:uroporphyrinogen decarboxylase